MSISDDLIAELKDARIRLTKAKEAEREAHATHRDCVAKCKSIEKTIDDILLEIETGRDKLPVVEAVKAVQRQREAEEETADERQRGPTSVAKAETAAMQGDVKTWEETPLIPVVGRELADQLSNECRIETLGDLAGAIEDEGDGATIDFIGIFDDDQVERFRKALWAWRLAAGWKDDEGFPARLIEAPKPADDPKAERLHELYEFAKVHKTEIRYTNRVCNKCHQPRVAAVPVCPMCKCPEYTTFRAALKQWGADPGYINVFAPEPTAVHHEADALPAKAARPKHGRSRKWPEKFGNLVAGILPKKPWRSADLDRELLNACVINNGYHRFEPLTKKGATNDQIKDVLRSLWPDKPIALRVDDDDHGFTVAGGDHLRFWIGPMVAGKELTGSTLIDRVRQVLQIGEPKPARPKRARAEAQA